MVTGGGHSGHGVLLGPDQIDVLQIVVTSSPCVTSRIRRQSGGTSSGRVGDQWHTQRAPVTPQTPPLSNPSSFVDPLGPTMLSSFFLFTSLLTVCHYSSANLNQMRDTNNTLQANGQSMHSKALEPESVIWSSSLGAQSDSTNQAGHSNTGGVYSWSPIEASRLIKPKPSDSLKLSHLPLQLPNSVIENRLQLQDFLSKIQHTNEQTDMHNFKTNLLKDRLYDCNLLPKLPSYEPHEEDGEQKLNIYDYQLYDVDLDRTEQPIDEKPKHFANFIYYDEPPRNYLSLNRLQLGNKKDGLEAESVMRHWKSTSSPTMCHDLEECYGGVIDNRDRGNHGVTRTQVNKQLLEMFNRHYFPSEESVDWSDPGGDLLHFNRHHNDAKRHHMFDTDDDSYLSYNTHKSPYQARKHYGERRSSKHRREPSTISKRRLLHRASSGGSVDNWRPNANHQLDHQSGGSKNAPSSDRQWTRHATILPWSPSAETTRVNSLSAWGTMHPSQTLSRLRWPKPVLVIKEYEEYNE